MTTFVLRLLYRGRMLKHDLGKTDLLATLRAERLKVTQERLRLSKEIASRQARIDKIDQRLRDMDHAEGMLR